jgi:integrase
MFFVLGKVSWSAAAGTADPDLVMSPADVIAIARACGQVDPRYEAFVLTQGLCGLRPGEAVELRVRNLTITDGDPVAVTVRGTHAEVPDRFLLDGETRRRPLKGRGHRASRTIPVFTVLRPVLARHLETYSDGRDATRVFTNTAGSKINLSNFHRDIWDAARTSTFPTDSALRHVRRHDLRHAAITAWLNAGVPLKTCQAWSGHATVSVLLDTYLGATGGDDQLGQQRVDAALHDLLDRDDHERGD